MPIALFAAAAMFVGNEACHPCHNAIVSSYEKTPMARSTMPVTSLTVPAGQFRHPASGLTYTVRSDGQVTVRDRSGITEEQRLAYVVGSGAAGHSYLVSRDRWLFQAPITWYSAKQRWAASPGYEADPAMLWDRPIDPSCLSCHASQLSHIYGTANRYAEPAFRQNGVSCERCHGPGSEHAQGRERMVKPSSLDPERRDDVCRQCHLMGESRIPRAGRAFGEFRAGNRLGDFVAYFVADDPAGPSLRTASHVEKLAASRCKQASGDKLWCGTCHDTHSRQDIPVSSFRAKCEGCHNPALPATSHCPRAENCIGCHMPKLPAVDAGHGAFTDHSIARRPARTTQGKRGTWRLKPFGAADTGVRELAIAYMELFWRNTLWRNNGDGTFTDRTREAGLDRKGLWTVAVFFDADNDGDEDLFLGHFVDWDAAKEPACMYGGRYHYCHPLSYPPAPSFFYRNNGDGTFADVSASSGIAAHKGKVFGAVATDIDNDGRLDLFVANDSVANFLFHNKGGGRFEEIGLHAGVAYSADGNPRSGMGVDAADYDGDGRVDLFVANFNRERFSIYRNRGSLTFDDEAGATGIGVATQMYSGWGVRFFDFDHDGRDDLVLCNSHPDDQIEKLTTTLTYKEPLLLLRNEGRRFGLLPLSRAGDAFSKNWPARGLAVGDLDNDGFPDIVIANTGEAPLILRHTGEGAGNWIGLDLRPRVAGTIVRWSAAGTVRQKLLNAGGSFLSADDPRVLLGLGAATLADWVEIRVPGKPVQRVEGLKSGVYHRR